MTPEEEVESKRLRDEIERLRSVLAQIDGMRDIDSARSLVRNTLNEVWVAQGRAGYGAIFLEGE